jgi:hypothetical protein
MIKQICFLLAILIKVSMACSFLTGIFSGRGSLANFTSQDTSPESVLLTWNSVDGAAGYQLGVRVSVRNSSHFPT